MKAREICEAAKAALRSGRYDMVRVNFANPDMVGHTGDLEATRTACELCDACVGELIEVGSAAEGCRAAVCGCKQRLWAYGCRPTWLHAWPAAVGW
jgi:bisphosphoglycerate-independent phosphoglycerate mutase (AlkP superfamily)